MTDLAIRTDGLTKTYRGTDALSDWHLEVP